MKSIVEKGYWDDLFPLEGGGRVHLQFQFALSEDDRSRIRMMVLFSDLIFLFNSITLFTELSCLSCVIVIIELVSLTWTLCLAF